MTNFLTMTIWSVVYNHRKLGRTTAQITLPFFLKLPLSILLHEINYMTNNFGVYNHRKLCRTTVQITLPFFLKVPQTSYNT